MNNQDLTVIVVSYNTKNITDKCLSRLYTASIFCQKKLNNQVKVVVVDNASKDKTAKMIRSKYPRVKLVKNKKNLGFARGNNLVMKNVTTPYILLLNSDAFLEKDTLVKAVEYMKNYKECDVLSVRLKYENGAFQPSGGNLPTPFRTLVWIMGIESIPFIKNVIKPIYIYNEKFYQKSQKMEWVSASFFLLRNKVYKVTEGFDEQFFMYMEDVEWCKRIINSNFNICYTPEISIVHLSGVSDSGNSALKLKRHIEGLLKYHKKHHKNSYLLIEKAVKTGLLMRFLFFWLKDKEEAGIYKELFHNI